MVTRRDMRNLTSSVGHEKSTAIIAVGIDPAKRGFTDHGVGQVAPRVRGGARQSPAFSRVGLAQLEWYSNALDSNAEHRVDWTSAARMP